MAAMDDDLVGNSADVILKTEDGEDGSGERIGNLINLVSELDSDTILHIVSPKLLDHFTIWDLMLQKAKLNADVGAMESILNDTQSILGELKLLIEMCLRPIRMGKIALDMDMRKRKRGGLSDFVKIDDMLSLALCLDMPGSNTVWKKRDTEEIHYGNPILNVDFLFPPRAESMGDDETPRVKKIKKEMDEDMKARLLGDDDVDDGARNNEDEDPDFSSPLPVKKKRGRKPNAHTAEIRRLLKKEDTGKFACKHCGKEYVSATSLYTHLEKKCSALKEIVAQYNEVDGKFFCTYEDCLQADDPFDTLEDVNVHWADDHTPDDDKVIPCVLCEKRFATPGAKKAHMRKVHQKPFKCTLCERTFALKENLEFHLSNHAEMDESQVAGAVAAAVEEANRDPVKAERKARAQAAKEAGNKERHLCLKCGQTVAAVHGRKHEAKCNGTFVRHPEYKKVNEEFFCTVAGCNIGYGFNSEYGLRKHFHGTHVREEEKFFACDYCDLKFSFRTAKNKHMVNQHIKPHVCDICGKGFGLKNKLTDHRLSHTGEKPHACDKCEYRAAKRSNLNAHKIDKHGDFGENKNYICAICNKQFTTMGRVRRHMETMHAEGKEESARNRRMREKLSAMTSNNPRFAAKRPPTAAAARPQKSSVQLVQPHQMEQHGAPQHGQVIQQVVQQGVPVHHQVVQQQVVQQVHHVVQPDEQEAAVQFLETHLDRELYQ